MNWDDSIVNLILVLIIKCWLHNMCTKINFDPLFKGDILVALRPKSIAMVIAGRSVHLTTLFPGQA